jgi:putative FmdB family regulatory protein
VPTYVYSCPKCKSTLELVQSINERKSPMCFEEDCDVEMENVIQLTSFSLKGPGWAKDGYSGGKK